MGKKSQVLPPRPWTARVVDAGNGFINEDGQRLYRREYVPPQVLDDKSAKGLVFYAHGASEHSQRNNEFLGQLVERGFVVVTHDHLGHGRSAGRRLDFPNRHVYIRDVIADLELSKQRYPGVKVYLLGLSLGGLIASMVATKMYVDGVVLLAPAVVIDPTTATPCKLCLARTVVHCAPRAAIAKLDPKLFTHDQEKLDELKADPHVYHKGVPAHWALDLLKVTAELQDTVDKVTAPLLILQGVDDRVCSRDGATFLMEHAGSTDKVHIEYEGLYHDLLNELKPDRERVFADIGNWLENKASGSALPLSASPAARLGVDPPKTSRRERRRAERAAAVAEASVAASATPAAPESQDKTASSAEATDTPAEATDTPAEATATAATAEKDATTAETAPTTGENDATAAEPASTTAENGATTADESAAASEPVAVEETAAAPVETVFGTDPAVSPVTDKRVMATAQPASTEV